jgi:fatty acid desaturase
MTRKTPGNQPPTVTIALIVGLMMCLCFTAIAAAVMPQFLLMIIVGIGMILFFALQYFAWAWWLYPIVVRKEQQHEEAAAQRQKASSSEAA